MYIPEYGFNLPLYYDQLEKQLRASVETVFADPPPPVAGSGGGGVGTDVSNRRAQFAAAAKEQSGGGDGEKEEEEEEDASKEPAVEKHIVTLHDGVVVEVAPMGHIRVEMRALPDKVGEYSILLNYD